MNMIHYTFIVFFFFVKQMITLKIVKICYMMNCNKSCITLRDSRSHYNHENAYATNTNSKFFVLNNSSSSEYLIDYFS